MIKKFSEIYKKSDTNRENDKNGKSDTNHLLTGNGFNIHFDYDTRYKNIFEHMKHSNKVSQDFYDEEFAKIVKDCKYDIELVLEKCLPLLKKRAIKLLEREDNINLLKSESITLRHPTIKERRPNDIIPRIRETFKLRFIEGQISESIMPIKSSFIGSLMGIMKDEDTEKKRERAAKFIENFSNRNSNIFTLNYDALLYNIGSDLRNRSESTDTPEWAMNDGFIEEGGKVFWKKGEEQNLFYIHGTWIFYQEEKEGGDPEIRKILDISDKELRLKVLDNLKSGKIWDIVFKSEGKYQDIEKNKYMEYALCKLSKIKGNCKLSKIKGNLFLYGLSLSKNDDHIWEAIRENEGINKVYISFHPRNDEDFRENVLAAFGKGALESLDAPEALDETGEERRVVFFDSDSIDEWV